MIWIYFHLLYIWYEIGKGKSAFYQSTSFFISGNSISIYMFQFISLFKYIYICIPGNMQSAVFGGCWLLIGCDQVQNTSLYPIRNFSVIMIYILVLQKNMIFESYCQSVCVHLLIFYFIDSLIYSMKQRVSWVFSMLSLGLIQESLSSILLIFLLRCLKI